MNLDNLLHLSFSLRDLATNYWTYIAIYGVGFLTIGRYMANSYYHNYKTGGLPESARIELLCSTYFGPLSYSTKVG